MNGKNDLNSNLEEEKQLQPAATEAGIISEGAKLSGADSGLAQAGQGDAEQNQTEEKTELSKLEVRAAEKTPEQAAAEVASVTDSLKAQREEATKKGEDVIVGDNKQPISAKEESPYAGLAKMTVGERFAITTGARAAGYSPDEMRALTQSITRIRGGNATAEDFDAVMDIHRMSPYKKERVRYDTDHQGKKVPSSIATTYTRGGRKAGAAVDDYMERLMRTASRQVRSDIISGEFKTASELREFAEAKTGLPGEAVVSYLKQEEMNILKASGQTSLEGQSAEYPILSQFIAISESQEDKRQLDLYTEKEKVREGTQERLYESASAVRLKEDLLRRQSNFLNAGGDSANWDEFISHARKNKFNPMTASAEDVAYFNQLGSQNKIRGFVSDGTVAMGEKEYSTWEDFEGTGNGQARLSMNNVRSDISALLSDNPDAGPAELQQIALAKLQNNYPSLTPGQAKRNLKPLVDDAVNNRSKEQARASVEAVDGELFSRTSEISAEMKNETSVHTFMTTRSDGSDAVQVSYETFIDNLSGSLDLSGDLRDMLKTDGYSGSKQVEAMKRVLQDSYRIAANAADIAAQKDMHRDQNIAVKNYNRSTAVANGTQLAVSESINAYKEDGSVKYYPIVGDIKSQKILDGINDENLPADVRAAVNEAMKASKKPMDVVLPGSLAPASSFYYDADVASRVIGQSMKRLKVDSETLKLFPSTLQDRVYKVPDDFLLALDDEDEALAGVLSSEKFNGAQSNLLDLVDSLTKNTSLSADKRKKDNRAILAEGLVEYLGKNNWWDPFDGAELKAGEFEKQLQRVVFSDDSGEIIQHLIDLGSDRQQDVYKGVKAALVQTRKMIIQSRTDSPIKALDYMASMMFMDIKDAAVKYASKGKGEEYNNLSEPEQLAAAIIGAGSAGEAAKIYESYSSLIKTGFDDMINLNDRFSSSGMRSDDSMDDLTSYYAEMYTMLERAAEYVDIAVVRGLSLDGDATIDHVLSGQFAKDHEWLVEHGHFDSPTASVIRASTRGNAYKELGQAMRTK